MLDEHDSDSHRTASALIDHLRSEVRDVKSCFTQFVFQGGALAAVAFAFILTTQGEHPEIVAAALPVIGVLMQVCRVGIFKYTTANRNLGYELHLNRLAEYERMGREDIQERVYRLRSIGWEEALRAWRVVQTYVFAYLYRTPDNKKDRSRAMYYVPWLDPGLYRPSEKAESIEKELMNTAPPAAHSGRVSHGDKQYPWWNQKLLTKHASRNRPIYHTGNYLLSMLMGLHIMQAALWALLFVPFFNPKLLPRERWLFVALAVLSGFVVLLRGLRINRRRVILEEELLSIHSCAITWAFVAIVHLDAAQSPIRPYFHYTERLAEISIECVPTNLPHIIGHYILTGQWPDHVSSD